MFYKKKMDVTDLEIILNTNVRYENLNLYKNYYYCYFTLLKFIYRLTYKILFTNLICCTKTCFAIYF